MKPTCALEVLAVSVMLMASLPAQEARPAEDPPFRLLQLVETGTMEEKINEAADKGYRLAAVSGAPGGSMAAIMEKDESSSFSMGNYRYRLVEAVRHLRLTKVDEQMSTLGSKGFHFFATVLLAPARRGPIGAEVFVMTMAPGPAKVYRYEVVGGGLLGYSQTKISSLIGSGYRMAGELQSALLFEKEGEAGGGENTAAGQSAMPSPRPYRFMTDRWNGLALPEKLLRKSAAEGYRLKDFFDAGAQRRLVMEPATPPSAPYEYLVIKPKRFSSAFAWNVKMSDVGEEELNQGGEKGFRLAPLRSMLIPFVMEKAHGSAAHYRYQMLSSPRFPDLVEKLTKARGDGYHVAKMGATQDGVVVIMEKADAAIGRGEL